MRILILYSSNAKALFVERVVDTTRRLVTENIELVKAPDAITLYDIDEEQVKINIPGHSYEVAVCLGLPGELLIHIPSILKQYGVKAVIIPVEDPRWIRPGLQKQLVDEFLKNNIRPSFPKPFCRFQDTSIELLREISEHMGRPKFSIKVSKEGIITDVKVLRTSPCGASYYVAKRLIGCSADKAPRIASLIHSYYCTASQVIDPLIRDSLLHKSCYITMRAVKEAVEHALKTP